MRGAAATIMAYFETFNEPVTLQADAVVDFWLLDEPLHEAGREKPHNLANTCIIALSPEGEAIREQLYTCALRRHHALDDAKALLAGWTHG